MTKLKLSIIAFLLTLSTLFMFVNQASSVGAVSIDQINASSYVLVDDSGTILISKNPHEKKEVASICKLMTTLITLENIESGKINLEDMFYASQYACDAEGSQAFLDAGKEYKVSDLLKSVIVASANDSAIVLAENIAGSESEFVKIMNSKAQELGMSNTLYANSTGLPAGKQYSTAYDTSILLKEVSKYDIYKKDCQIWMDELVHESGRVTELVNTNRLIKYYNYCKTGKTGYTEEAGYCLSSTASKDNVSLTCVVLGCSSPADRFTDSISLYNYGFANYTSVKIIDSSVELDKTISVQLAKENTLHLVSAKDYYLTTNKNENPQYSIEYNLPNQIKAPVESGNVVGQMKVIVNGDCVVEIDVLAKDSIAKQDYKDVINKIIDNFGIIN